MGRRKPRGQQPHGETRRQSPVHGGGFAGAHAVTQHRAQPLAGVGAHGVGAHLPCGGQAAHAEPGGVPGCLPPGKAYRLTRAHLAPAEPAPAHRRRLLRQGIQFLRREIHRRQRGPNGKAAPPVGDGGSVQRGKARFPQHLTDAAGTQRVSAQGARRTFSQPGQRVGQGAVLGTHRRPGVAFTLPGIPGLQARSGQGVHRPRQSNRLHTSALKRIRQCLGLHPLSPAQPGIQLGKGVKSIKAVLYPARIAMAAKPTALLRRGIGQRLLGRARAGRPYSLYGIPHKLQRAAQCLQPGCQHTVDAFPSARIGAFRRGYALQPFFRDQAKGRTAGCQFRHQQKARTGLRGTQRPQGPRPAEHRSRHRTPFAEKQSRRQGAGHQPGSGPCAVRPGCTQSRQSRRPSRAASGRSPPPGRRQHQGRRRRARRQKAPHLPAGRHGQGQHTRQHRTGALGGIGPGKPCSPCGEPTRQQVADAQHQQALGSGGEYPLHTHTTGQSQGTAHRTQAHRRRTGAGHHRLRPAPGRRQQPHQRRRTQRHPVSRRLRHARRPTAQSRARGCPQARRARQRHRQAQPQRIQPAQHRCTSRQVCSCPCRRQRQAGGRQRLPGCRLQLVRLPQPPSAAPASPRRPGRALRPPFVQIDRHALSRLSRPGRRTPGACFPFQYRTAGRRILSVSERFSHFYLSGQLWYAGDFGEIAQFLCLRAGAFAKSGRRRLTHSSPARYNTGNAAAAAGRRANRRDRP